MEFIDTYVQTRLDFESAEANFLKNLEEIFGIPNHNVKNIRMSNRVRGSSIIQVLEVELSGTNVFRSKDVAKVKELRIITPNLLEFDVGEIHL